MKFIDLKNSKINIIIMIILLILSCSFCSNITKNKEMATDMQFDSFGELTADFTWVEIDNPGSSLETGLSLEQNSIIIEPYNIKLIYKPMAKSHLIKMQEIIVFNNFEIMFGMNLLSKNIFGVVDRERQTKATNVLEKLRQRYAQNAESCKIIL